MLNVLFPRKRWGSCATLARNRLLPDHHLASASAQGRRQTPSESKSKTSSKSGQPEYLEGKWSDGQTSGTRCGVEGGCRQRRGGRAVRRRSRLTRARRGRSCRMKSFATPRLRRSLASNIRSSTRERTLRNEEVLSFHAMAADPNATLDTNLMDRVIDAQIARLTDHANILAVLEPRRKPVKPRCGPFTMPRKFSWIRSSREVHKSEERRIFVSIQPVIGLEAQTASEEPSHPAHPGDDHPGRERKPRRLGAI